ncbi:MAG: GNAT family N-acetyltransferase [Bacteroidota bacterium]
MISNIPEFFAAEELQDFKEYLDHKLEIYFVLELNGALIGGGGLHLNKQLNEAIIAWDFIRKDYHGNGFGAQLLNKRIQLAHSKGFNKIIVRTSQVAYQFYAKSGFELQNVEKDYWAKGFDLYYMLKQ